MPKFIITGKPDTIRDYLLKIWKYRSLIWIFAVRDLKVKYAQTWLGLGWSILQPLTSLAIFTFFFGFVLSWDAGDLPYSIYVLSGLLGWNFFSYIVSSGAASLQDSSQLIKKIYFPKSVLPLSKVLVALVELVASLVLLILLMIYFGEMVSWKIVFLPFVLLFNIICGLALVFWVAAFAYRMRDLYHLLPYVVYFGIWLTPVFFVVDFFPETLVYILDFNPISNVVELWRWMLFSYSDFKTIYLVNFVIMLFLCVWGMYVFNKKENRFSDYA